MSTLAVNSITDTTGLLPPTFPAGSAQLNPMAGREDKVINGDFSVWQRATSSAALGFVAADRWFNDFIGGTATQSRQAFTMGETLGVNSPTHFMRLSVSGQTLPSHEMSTYQKVENVRSYAGQTITILGWARRSSGATGNMAVEGFQNFGTTLGVGGGGISPGVPSISTTTVTLGSTWSPFAVVMTVPSVTGKTLGADGNDHFAFIFWTSAGSNYAARTNSLGLQTIGVDLWGIHIRQGTWTAAATADYRPRDPGTELALCQRYYQTAVMGGTNGAISATGQVFSATAYLPVVMRATPNPTQLSEAILAFPSGVPAFIDNGAQGTAQVSAYKISNAANTNARWTSILGLDAEL